MAKKQPLSRYKVFLLLALINTVIVVIYPVIGMKSLEITWANTLEMLAVIPPIFVLLGLLDVWVKRETMVKYMGERSGVIGGLIAFLIGSAAIRLLLDLIGIAVIAYFTERLLSKKEADEIYERAVKLMKNNTIIMVL